MRKQEGRERMKAGNGIGGGGRQPVRRKAAGGESEGKVRVGGGRTGGGSSGGDTQTAATMPVATMMMTTTTTKVTDDDDDVDDEPTLPKQRTAPSPQLAARQHTHPSRATARTHNAHKAPKAHAPVSVTARCRR